MEGLTNPLRFLRFLPDLSWQVVSTKMMVRGGARGDERRVAANQDADTFQDIFELAVKDR